MIIDIFTFNGEYDLLEIRLNILDKFVDQFIIVEAPTTFSGNKKPLYYEIQKDRYKKWHDKIKYHVIDENYTNEEIALAWNSPNTGGAEHWVREFLQKESARKALTHLKDDDICFVGDLDEIWDTTINFEDRTEKLKLKVCVYQLNHRSSEEFWGTLVTNYKTIKASCLNHLRSDSPRGHEYTGWHFTNMGGTKEIIRKIESYGHQEFNTDGIKEDVEFNLRNGLDYVGRDFDFWIDDIDLPKFLLDNRAIYGSYFK